MNTPYNLPLVRRLVDLALEEDLGFGDVTTSLTLVDEGLSRVRVIAREPLTVCGLGIVPVIASSLGVSWRVDCKVVDGTQVMPNEVLVEIEGTVQSLLGAERTLLNFIQRLSGVATHVQGIVAKAPGLTILDTRKTTPGWRLLEKYATRVGGAKNHRLHMGDLILIKNNHIDAARARGISLSTLLERIDRTKPWGLGVECEVRNFEELEAALAAPITIVMLDNMSIEEISHCCAVIRQRRPELLIEVSGGIAPDLLPHLEALGRIAVSMGTLTTGARSVDISLRVA